MLVYQRVAGRTLALGHWDIARYCHCPKKSLRKRLGLRLGLPWVYHGLLFTSAKASNKVCLSLVDLRLTRGEAHQTE